MGHVKIDLRNCYGIRELQYDFDFSKHSVYAIYAPNGSMKTSFALTFKDFSEGKDSLDRMIGGRVCSRNITNEGNAPISRDSILVLPPYDEFFGQSDKTATLLVNNALRKQYEQINSDLEKSKSVFIQGMQKRSRSKKDLEKEIALAFTKTVEGDSFFVALERAHIELAEQKDAPFAEVEYDSIFDDKIITALATKDVKGAIEQYG